mgnify:CR=1 FL=1
MRRKNAIQTFRNIGVLVIFLMTIISIWVFSKKSKLEIDYKQSEIELTNLKSKKFYKGLNYLLTTYLYFLPFGLLFNYFFFITLKDLYVIPKWGIILVIIWIFIFSYKYKLRNYRKTLELNNRILTVLVLVQIVVCFIIYENYDIMKARKILAGIPAYTVSLKKENQQIKTNDNILYFGETSVYVFFRDIKNKKNIIYNKSSFEEFNIHKIEK